MKSRQNTEVSLIVLSLIMLITSIPVNAQMIEWTKTYGGPDQDGAQAMVTTNNGGIVIAGFKSSNSVKDVLIMKTDASGNELWSRVYNLAINDWGRALEQTQDGGFIIAGFTEVTTQIHDPFLIKTDSAGNMQWQQNYDYGFGDDDRAHAVAQTSDGGYIIAGQTWLVHGPFGNYDMYIIKTDINGNVQWKKVFFRENEGGDVALAVQQLSDGGYIIGGFTQSSTWASYIIRTDSLGNAVWSNIYPGAWQSECYDIQETPDGGFILTGTETSFTTDGDLLIIKLNGSGNVVWKKIYGTVDSEQGEFIRQLQDGFVIAGMSTHGAGGYDLYVLRTNSTGDSLWSKTIGGAGDDRAFAIASGDAGSVFVSGWAWSYGQGLGDVYLVKLQDSAMPVELTAFTVKANGADVILEWSTAIELNNSGFEVQKKYGSEEWRIIGFIKGSGTTQQSHNYSFIDKSLAAGSYSYRIKQKDFDGKSWYSSEIEIEVSGPMEFNLAQNYPNPFNPETTIQFSIPEAQNVKLIIYNALGEKAAELVNEGLQAGNYNYSWNAKNYAGGMYLYQLVTEKNVSTRKMILMK